MGSIHKRKLFYSRADPNKNGGNCDTGRLFLLLRVKLQRTYQHVNGLIETENLFSSD